MSAATTPSPAMACSHPHGDAKYDGSNGVKVPRANPMAIVIVWYGESPDAAAVAVAPASVFSTSISQVSVDPDDPR